MANKQTKASIAAWMAKRDTELSFWEYYTALCEEDRKKRFSRGK